MSTKAKEVTKAAQAAQAESGDGSELIVQGGTLPAYIQQGTNRGNENVTNDDVIVPRIEIVQALSPCLDEKNEGAYIPGAKQGMLFNSLTRKLYGTSVMIVPVLFAKQWLVWRDRKRGGGFRGAHPTEEAARAAIAQMPAEDREGWEPADTAQHMVLIPSSGGKIEQAMVSMSRTKLKVSRQLNSLVRQAGGDRFSRAYELTAVQERNSKNELYYNFGVRPIGFPSQAMYEHAFKLYTDITSGARTYTMDTSDMDADVGDGTAANTNGGARRSEF